MSRSERWRLVLDVVSTVALTVTCLVLLAQRFGTARSQIEQVQAVDEASSAVEVVAFDIPLTGAAQGAESAPLGLVEFADFECPFCATFARNTYPQLKREYIDTGALKFEFRHYPLEEIHPYARPASIALECAGAQRQYWSMHSRLFLAPQQLAEQHLTQHARALNLDTTAFTQCLASEPLAIGRDLEEARRLNVSSTPTFFIGHVTEGGKLTAVRRIQGAVPYDVFKATLTAINKS